MRALITGAGGQLGLELIGTAPPTVELIALDHNALDITDEGAVRRSAAEHRPDVILNAAAYTAVDRAEREWDAAWSINGDGVGNLARRAAEVGARLIHVSTDFVFDGTATEPYRPDSEPNPLSEYGASKLEGEAQALESAAAIVVRASRVFSNRGNNFVTGMLRRMREDGELTVVDDQVGSPTWARGLAEVLWLFAERTDLTGIWHWSDGGSCTWYGWATSIQQQAVDRGLLERIVPIRAVASAEYPTPAARPAFSVLDSSATCTALAIQQVPWEDTLGTMLDQMADSASL